MPPHTPRPRPPRRPWWLPFGLLAAALTLVTAVHAQPSTRAFVACSSDGQAAPRRLVERFLDADCEACWRQAPGGGTASRPRASAGGDAVIDWVLPGRLGDEAPLSAVALRDGVWRLQALQQDRPATSGVREQVLAAAGDASAPRLRVAHGSAVLGYIGVSVELTPARGGPWRVWLALTEQLPAGTEGSAVPRELLRGSLQLDWSARAAQGRAATPAPWRERRVMQLPEGANPDRLRLTGWVEDAQGRMAALVRSACPR